MAAANSGSHLSPLDSSFSATKVSLRKTLWAVAGFSSHTLVVKQLLASLGGVLGVGRLDNGINRT